MTSGSNLTVRPSGTPEAFRVTGAEKPEREVIVVAVVTDEP